MFRRCGSATRRCESRCRRLGFTRPEVHDLSLPTNNLKDWSLRHSVRDETQPYYESRFAVVLNGVRMLAGYPAAIKRGEDNEDQDVDGNN